MDINNMDEHQDDETIGSIDDAGFTRTAAEGNDVGTELEPVEKADGSQVYDPAVWSSAPKKCPKTGRFLPGTGGSLRGGRPRGARDKITDQMIRLAEETAAEYGEEMFKRLAKDDPAACLALITRLLPNSDLSKAIEGESAKDDAIQQVTINVVGGASDRLPDSRTQAQITDQQRGLNSPVERIERASEPVEVVATQDDADEQAARDERERQARQNEAVRAHGGLTGRPARGSAPDTLDYPDDQLI